MFEVWGLRFRVPNSNIWAVNKVMNKSINRVRVLGIVAFRGSDSGFRNSHFGLGIRIRIPGFGVRVSGFGFWVPGFELVISGFGFRISGVCTPQAVLSCFRG